MDEEKRTLWKLLWQDCVKLHSDLGQFCYLFAEDKDRVVLMNKASSVFFGNLQGTLWNSILLRLCRITDPPKSVGKSNLSLRFFLNESAADQGTYAQDRAGVLVKVAEARSIFARDWRNRRIAHRDLSNATGASFCETATLLCVKEAAEAIGKAMDALDPDGATTHWWPGITAAGMPLLLRYLQEGIISHQQRIEAQRKGELPWGDVWLKKPIIEDEVE